MQKKKQEEPLDLDIELDEKVAEGVYSNLAIVNHSMTEFILDFVSVMPGPKAKVKSRIILTPEHAKRLVETLMDNIQKFDDSQKQMKSSPQVPPINFGPTGQA